MKKKPARLTDAPVDLTAGHTVLSSESVLYRIMKIISKITYIERDIERERELGREVYLYYIGFFHLIIQHVTGKCRSRAKMSAIAMETWRTDRLDNFSKSTCVKCPFVAAFRGKTKLESKLLYLYRDV